MDDIDCSPKDVFEPTPPPEKAAAEAEAENADVVSEKPRRDLYVVLGAEKSDDQHTISKKYKKQALKFHPDRNRGEGQDVAAEKFKELADAYAVLSDPNRRRQYDVHGDSGDAKSNETHSFETVDVKSVGWLGRFIIAQAAKLGVPIPTSVSADVISQAQETAQNPQKLAQMPALEPGRAVQGKLALASAAFFRLPVDAAMAKDGVFLACKTKRKNDRFRIIVFDARGNVRRQAESSAPDQIGFADASARCRLFVLPHAQVLVGAPFPPPDEATPAVCASLDTLESRAAADPPFEAEGDYLCCVYNDNLLSQLDFTLASAPAVLDEDALEVLDFTAQALREKKSELATFAIKYAAQQLSFMQAQAAFQAAQEEMKAHEKDVQRLRKGHGAAQAALLKCGFDACPTPQPQTAQPAKTAFGAFLQPRNAKSEALPAAMLDL
ncbi:hypothetical protein M885DRAFT_592358 [Pelagophyceae sp. CCMP2097]|nr:hypothetical protein M885DRAFT_592358 [Pelagophyceae sp. CCMP2097]|mmetsp:Transcript_26319/g.88459  ORF Transcript_26319/g.88459 Transcript_26319/m.88459 type:complete len:439 (-) Transcript_26319:48-1364(-)